VFVEAELTVEPPRSTHVRGCALRRVTPAPEAVPVITHRARRGNPVERAPVELEVRQGACTLLVVFAGGIRPERILEGDLRVGLLDVVAVRVLDREVRVARA